MLEGLNALNLPLPACVVDRLLDYLALIQKWNRVYNLTSLHALRDMLTLHVLDSLAVLPALTHRLTQLGLDATALRVLDVGSGAGLPGVVWGIVHPEWRVDCVDAVAKKAAFIQQAAVTLQLPGVRGIHARVETLGARYDLICSRAFAALGDFVSLTVNALESRGVWLALKGQHPEAELAALPDSVEVFHVEPLTVPGLDAQRCLVWMRQRTAADSVARKGR
ncbi:MAG: 16S rRNA (guanine(527)-N(7))-methyltransferase RsmG [Rhodoferax sp.]